MKNVFITKDAYIDKTVRVNYWEKDRVFKTKAFEFKEERKELEEEKIEQIKDYLLFCERLTWNEDETELDSRIEERRLEYQERINK